jgi:hypothetical protein
VAVTETRCELTELIASQCAHCKGLVDVGEELQERRARLLQSVRWIAAAYPGRCTGCGDWYTPGTAITRDDTGWRAECCEETQ